MATNSMNVESTVDSGSNDSGSKPGRIFENSTHQYLMYFGHDKDCAGLLLGIGCLIIQYVLYSVIVAEGVDLFNKDLVPVQINWFDCFDGLFSEIECTADIEDGAFTFMAFALLAIYLMGDVIGSVKGFFMVSGIFSKIAAIVIILSSVYAGYAGAIFAYQGIYVGSKYDSIINCIGVLFINDIDEKLYEAVSYVGCSDKLKNGCSCLFCNCCDSFFQIICVVLCIVIFVIIGYISVVEWFEW
jgi:hypothetical protein